MVLVDMRHVHQIESFNTALGKDRRDLLAVRIGDPAVDQHAFAVGALQQQAVALVGRQCGEFHRGVLSTLTFACAASARQRCGVIRPKPASLTHAKLPPGSGRDVPWTMPSICVAVSFGCMASISAATPATYGLAMLVPAIAAHRAS